MLWYNKYSSDELKNATEGLYKFFFEQTGKMGIGLEKANHLMRTFRAFLEGFILLENHNSFGNPILIIESMWSQTLVIHMIRTPKLPFIQSRASLPLTMLTFTGIAVLTIIPFTPFRALLGFVALSASYFAYLIPCILLYMMLATSLKKAYVRHFGELL